MTLASSLIAALLCLLVTACAKKAPDDSAHPAHAHTAPHGGVLVELGHHAYNLEFVRDPAAGKLTVYVLDGHAENFVRIQAPSFGLNAKFGAETRSLLFQAVPNSATGETIGDTSQFEASAEWLKSAVSFDAALPSLEIRGTTFTDIAVRL